MRPRKIFNRYFGISITIVAVVVFMIVFRGSVSRALAYVQRPLVGAGTWIATRTVGIFDSMAVSPERLQELEGQRNAVIVDRAEFERLRVENQELSAQLKYLTRHQFRSVTASVVSRSVGPDASAFVIDRGADDGIVTGAPAISGDGILVGKVVAVTSSSATVRVLSDRDSATAVTLLNGTRTIGLSEGNAGALLSLSYIPQDEQVNVNDIVVTSGLEPLVPSGLLVGIVNKVVAESTAPFQSAVLEPLSDVRRISVVSVILPDAL